MIDYNVNEAISGCKEIIIKAIYDQLKITPGSRIDLEDAQYPAISSEGTVIVNTYTSIHLDENQNVIVEYSDYYGEYADPADLFSIDELDEILRAI